MQVFDLMQLLDVVSPPVTFTETAHYGNAGSVHNIALNEATGYAYLIGGSSGAEECNGGLHMVNVQNPTAPAFAGCYSGDGYTHDTQCVIYNGPDTEHVGKEICFSSNEDTLTITDVTDKANPILIERQPYTGADYSHQGWLTADHRYFLLDDELDGNSTTPTATYIWDLLDLDNALHTGTFDGTTIAQDHNQYIVGDHSFQANYKAGLRILDISDVANANLDEIAFFDTYPANDTRGYSGAWSNYPFFASGTVVVSDINRGLFLLRPNLTQPPTAVEVASLATAPAAGPNFALFAGIALAGVVVVGIALRRRS
jgi:choice-of-anchor B domain-containing protein